ncbi:unnamed protein product [Microthlaspi erraticum]|uniref:Uncharacterized protein n=1 Tax=Microthlaspi erraticum TaxID=1685480 RepID=A0A6D2HTW8_9BRAS|nr:unnamed protein product [Microthlaspi erraticum]
MSKEKEMIVLTKVSRHENCCIFKAPTPLQRTNPKAFQPEIVSVGPYHYNDKGLETIQMHKQRFLELFLETGNRLGGPVSMTSLEDDVGALEETIRDSYSEHLQLSREELVKIMILDGCFIIMVVLVALRHVSFGSDTIFTVPIFTVPWILPTLRRDLLLLENQVPYIVLETLFAKSGIDVSLKRLLCEFFSSSLRFLSVERVMERIVGSEPRHLLHLIRQSQIPPSSSQLNRLGATSYVPRKRDIFPARKLELQGIEFKADWSANTILAIGLQNNALVIPHLLLDQFTGTLLYNVVAFEQCCMKSEDHFTSYIVLMGFLMNDKEDVSLLREKCIIGNCFSGDYEKTSHFFKGLSKCIALDLSRTYFEPTFEVINAYTCKRGTGYWARFKRNYFDSPWVLVSFIVVFLMLIAVFRSVVAPFVQE